MTVTRPLRPVPFRNRLLYQPRWIQTCIMTNTVNKRLHRTCATAQLCQAAWMFPCPAACRLSAAPQALCFPAKRGLDGVCTGCQTTPRNLPRKRTGKRCLSPRGKRKGADTLALYRTVFPRFSPLPTTGFRQGQFCPSFIPVQTYKKGFILSLFFKIMYLCIR